MPWKQHTFKRNCEPPKSVSNSINFDWFEHVKSSLVSHLWYTDGNAKQSHIKGIIKRRINSFYHDKWLADVVRNSQCRVYRIYKRAWGMSEYLTILDAKRRIPITKFLTGNHYLPVNANRFKKSDEPDKPIA